MTHKDQQERRTWRNEKMNQSEFRQEVEKGEDSFRQFKEKFSSIDQLAAEIAAFANSQGGTIFLGVIDDGKLIGINKDSIKHLNQWISNATSQKIDPPLFVQTENLLIEDKKVMIINVPQGGHKPYCVNKSDYWVKTGADKRRASREELFRLMQASARLYADEMITAQEIGDFDFIYFTEIYRQIFEQDLEDLHVSRQQLLQNLKLANDKNLTLAGVMLFGKHVQFYQPQFSIKATSYLNEDEYRDKEDISGKLLEQQKQGVDFVLRNLHRLPNNTDFNSPAQLEIPRSVITEAIANAVVH